MQRTALGQGGQGRVITGQDDATVRAREGSSGRAVNSAVVVSGSVVLTWCLKMS